MKSILIAIVFVLMASQASAQKEESPKVKAERLAKLAEANRQDWRMQYDAGICYIDTAVGGGDLLPAEIYLARALDIARAQTTRRDTILAKSLEAMSDLYFSRGKYADAIAYYEKAVSAYIEEFGTENAIVPLHIALLASRKVLTGLGTGEDKSIDAVNLMRAAKGLNGSLPEEKRTKGLEEADFILILAHEILMLEHISLMKDKAWTWTDPADGKIYTILAFDDWTCERQDGFFATLLHNAQNAEHASQRKYGLVLLDDKGTVKELEHPEFQFQMGAVANGDAYYLGNNGNLHLADITSERQKQLVEAWHTFEKKEEQK